ncbi:MAG: NAD-dependent epimerase/dehydratase family protein [Armatimonadetes bacterium]|nr:NAD-dependent epimerase/dehydratase family protein [Armatimonadota bacterium]
MNCLVTGCAGFIGSTLSEKLLSLGCNVVGIDNFSDYYSKDIKLLNLSIVLSHPRFRFVEGDLLALDLKPLLSEVDWVFHEAAQPGVRMSWGANFGVYVRNNILATQRLLESAVGTNIRRLVYASSSSVYGNSPELPLRESAKPQPVSPYGVTKLAAENLCHLYFVNYGLPVVSLRYFTVYGPRQRPDMAFHRFIRAAIKGEELIIYGNGKQTRDFTYVSDVCDANLLAAQAKEVEGEVFNIGGGSHVDLNKVVEAIGELVGHSLNVRRVEDQLGDMRHTLSDISAARKRLGYSPKVSLHDGLASQVSWMLSL